MNGAASSRGFVCVVLAAVSATLAGASAHAVDLPPAAPIQPVTDDYFGTAVVDNYRYLENLKDPQVQAWMKAQADYTRAALDSLPGRQALLDRVHELSNADTRRGAFVRRGQRTFYLVFEPNAPLPKLCYRDGLKGEEHVLLDPATLGKGTSTHYALDFFMPSWDGRRLAYGVSAGGSEQSLMHVLEVDSGKLLQESIDRATNSVVAWRPDNRSFFYLRYAKPTANTPASAMLYNGRTYLHVLGTHVDGEGDPVVFGRGVSPRVDVPEGQGTFVVATPGSAYAIAVANHNMDANPSTLFVAPLASVTGSGTPWHRIASVEDGVTELRLRGEQLLFLSQKGAPRFRLLSTSLAHPDIRNPRVLVAEDRAVITDFAIARDGLYVRERDGALSHLLRVSLDGRQKHHIALPFEGSLNGLITDARESGALFTMQSWVRSPVVLAYDPADDTSSDTGLILPSKVDTSELEAKEVFAVSYDGTRIPLSVIYKKGIQPDQTHRTLLRGYGSYGISLEPSFEPTILAWVERGGVLAVAHIRGGGEYGEDWHRAGFMLTKTNTIFDFIACGQYLVDAHYTSPKLLGAIGGSAGGITVGGALTWRPDLFGVILDLVGMSDALRTETEPNGPPNVSEFGSVESEAGFHGLYAMGAYEHVRDGTPYPAVMFSTGVNDPRVSPWHMAKMAARVQAATSSHKPVLLRVDYDAGHGIGSTRSQRETLQADLWSFALWQMGDPQFQPAAKP
ncbi:MAG TPA: prolyl oligopeptidase family serine peptidase [Burkholderiaceae bacterium]|nr:prolyl oligopeptidase family serine peptidase [Burkholderiaceae bacterium]